MNKNLSLILNGQRYTCTPAQDPVPDDWAFPVGEQGYPVERWYVAVMHGPNANYRSGYHTGWDINLAMYEFGDVERRLGLSTFSVAPGVVEWIGEWSGTGTAVIRHEHNGEPLWVRYAHIVPTVKKGDAVKAKTKLGPFDNWRPGAEKRGDHLHLDMRIRPIGPDDWCTPPLIEWLNPGAVLKAHLDPRRVTAMVAK